MCRDGEERASKPIPLLAPTTAIVFPSIPTFAISISLCWIVFQGQVHTTVVRLNGKIVDRHPTDSTSCAWALPVPAPPA